MGLAITTDHQLLESVVQDWAVAQGVRGATREAYSGAPGARAVPDPLWKQVVELGWPAVALAQDVGGEGYGLPELAVVLEGLGRELYAGPLLSSAVVALLVDAYGTPAQRTTLLPGLATGTTVASVVAGPGIGAGHDGQFSGGPSPALGAAWATLFVVRRGADAVIFDADAVTLSSLDVLDPSLGVASVQVDGSGEVLAGGGAALTRLLRIAVAVEAAGNARATLDSALAYAKVREQFGRLIGSFQAVKHHLADMLVRSELAVAAAWDAARVDAGPSGGHEADLTAAVAATVCLDAAVRNAQTSIQVLGGIGFSWEHDAHLYLRRALTMTGLVGPVDNLAAEVTRLSVAGTRRKVSVTLPAEAEKRRSDAREFVARWQAAPQRDRRGLLVESGYLVPHWERPWGRAAGPVEQLVIEDELRSVDVPDLVIGGWVMLTLSQFGTPEQLERWVRPGLMGEIVWCQLFSEPGAGSDAAAVSTRGERVEGGWRINGQKVWTSNAQNAHRGLATVRTDPSASKHGGITAMVIDLTVRGVTRRPLREITGASLFNEVFFDDVFVPDEDVVGEPGGGWSVARATLSNERIGIGGGSGSPHWDVGNLLDLTTRCGADDSASRVGVLVAESQAADMLNVRAVERAVLGSEPGAEGNISKLTLAEHTQRVTELSMQLAGVGAVVGGEPLLVFEYLLARSGTIAGGTSEVSRNVIAERILGLPRGAVFN
jgi:alkylation response protein AidB-like acyl-CoA dehydrogenase